MKRLTTILAIVALGLAVPALAVQPDSSGPHFNLNIIGFAN